jgi:integrase
MQSESSQDRRLVKTGTPGIFKRDNRYIVVYRDPQGRQRKAFGTTLSAARDLKAEKRADVVRGEYRALSKTTFADYAQTWLTTYSGRTSRGIEQATVEDYRKRLEADAIPFLGRMRLVAIEPQHLKALAAKVADRGVSQNTVRLAVAPVKAMLATAHEEGLIRSNPSAGLRLAIRPRTELDDVEPEQVKALTEAELQALLDKMPDGWRWFFTFLSETGLRVGEAVELRWSDVDLGDRWIGVNRRFYKGRVGLPKGRKRRKVRLSMAMAQALWRLRGSADDDGLVFTAEKGGRVDQSNLMSRVLKPAAVRAGLGSWVGKPLRAESWVGFHTFRHTCATRLFRSGWNAVQVQKFLGHSDPGFTLRTYVHLLPEDLPELPFGALVETAAPTASLAGVAYA